MNMHLLPEKHVRMNETLLGLGALVLESLIIPMSLDGVWEHIKFLRQKKKIIPQKTSFEELVLAVNFLYAVRTIDFNEEGKLKRCV